MSEDRNFDDIADKLSSNIYGTSKGKVRETVVWQDLNAMLAQLPPGPLRILDAGGGEGRMARRLAALGHEVTLCDISGEMVSRARDAAAEENLARRMRFIHCPLQEIEQHLTQPVDLILLHAVLE
ncbi:MAG: methyltransferase domain-containing protein, partial [Enterobacteriaceae bacterium]